eukprot:CAMPEP_0170552078 /NCGR_PEP_ID=MMETSP0211-20121228/10046_1 /TAXON_ID=311385 /ORGANISM="Pseudokeronopsis sp., Strain OXSARD2" /LENGTH=74 /DNA_ID=CAMNT_0010859625 /DNA_START=1066 /DNA_END=1290 /DNA_ORIENTATION=-
MHRHYLKKQLKIEDENDGRNENLSGSDYNHHNIMGKSIMDSKYSMNKSFVGFSNPYLPFTNDSFDGSQLKDGSN